MAHLSARSPTSLNAIEFSDSEWQRFFAEKTMREYERFEQGAADSNVLTSVLKRQLEDPDARIIITTIQKLSRFVEQNKGHEIYGGHVVLIFDECHRSQFGDMHVAIEKAFRRYHCSASPARR